MDYISIKTGTAMVDLKSDPYASDIIDERLLVKEAQQDLKKFDVLYRKYYEAIFRFIYQRVDDKDLAHDLTSNVFLKCMENLHRYEYKNAAFSSWLYRIASNQVIDLYRANSKYRVVNIDSSGLANLIEDFEDNSLCEYSMLLSKLIANLEEADLQLVEMRYFEKRSFKEIGEIFSITENNAKVRTYRLLDKLKEELIKNKF